VLPLRVRGDRTASGGGRRDAGRRCLGTGNGVGWSAVSPLAMAAVGAGFAGLAAALAVPSPAGPMRATVAQGERGAGRAGWRRIAAMAAGRPDGLPLSRRLLAGSMAMAGVALGVIRAVPDLALVAVPSLMMLSFVVSIALGWVEPARSRRRRHQLQMDVPQALELLASCLTAGLPLGAATAAVARVCTGPVREDLSTVLRLIDLGVSETDAWRTLREHPQLGAAAVDLARSAQWGTMLVGTLNHHAKTARQRRQAVLQVVARAVGVRSVLPLMMCFLPAFLLIGIVPAVVSAISQALS
jgi:Flp pilus assembly protein TadB